MSRFFSAFGTAFIAVGFLCAPSAALATTIVYVFFTPKGQVTASILIGLLAGFVEGSAISNAADLSKRLTAAIAKLTPPPTPPPLGLLNAAVRRLLAMLIGGAAPPGDATGLIPRADVAAVRNAINRYRESQWSGLI